MASTFTKSLYQCIMTRGNIQKSVSLAKRIDCNISNLSRLALSPSLSSPVGGGSLSRSIWHLAPFSSRNYKSSNSWPTVSCTCGSFHSKGDVAFSGLLKEEIAAEKERMLELPQLSDGWSLKHEGSDCKLHKKLANDSIVVSFNVNASVPPATTDDPDEEQAIIAQPDFVVEVKKAAVNDSLSFECYFPDEDLADEQQKDHDNIFSIRSVILHKGEVTESTYIMDTDNLDPSFYQHMLTYLEERGVNSEFAEELVDVATAIENHQYINSLERLQKFIDCK